MLRLTLIAVATLFVAGLVVFVAAHVISDDHELLGVGFLLLFPFAALAFLAVLVAIVAESRNLEIAWKAVAAWLVLTAVVGFVWLNGMAAWGMAGAHGSGPVRWSSSEAVLAGLANTVYILPATLIAIYLRRRSRA